MTRPLFTSLLAMRLSASMTALFVAGCGPTTGGQTGDLGGAHDGEQASPNVTTDTAVRCETDDVALTDLDADTELGFSPNDVLAFADQEFEVSVAWGDPEDTSSVVSIAPESGVTDLTLRIQFAAGEVLFSTPTMRTAEPPPSGDSSDASAPTPAVGTSTPARSTTTMPAPADLLTEGDTTSTDGAGGLAPADTAASACQDHVAFEVTVSAVSAGGALDETFDATLIATSGDAAAFSVSIDPAELNGTLMLTPTDGEVLELVLSAEVTPTGVTGTLTAGIETVSGSGTDAVASYQQVVIASWPAP